uniref:IlvH n=1 Tax=Schizocladia ischiensis TaxID=196139 RepID=A0A7S6U9T5_9STRA|nr:ilvH [Schizocladia ischiensis]QOW07470.1 ilvH [Schizocladia ischiensis]
MIIKRTFSIKVEEERGVLVRVASLVSRREFTIVSIAIGPTEQKGISRISLVFIEKEKQIEFDRVRQLMQHLRKLINVLDVIDLTFIPSIEKELILIKIQCSSEERKEILEIANSFNLVVVDFAKNCLTLEIVTDSKKFSIIHKILSRYNVIEQVHSGTIGLTRQSSDNKDWDHIGYTTWKKIQEWKKIQSWKKNYLAAIEKEQEEKEKAEKMKKEQEEKEKAKKEEQEEKAKKAKQENK